MIDIESLVALRTLEQHGTVTAAAEYLGYTPSAVSQQIKRLERSVGVPLLEKVGRRVVLTGPARHLVADGSRVIEHLEHLESSLLAGGGKVSGPLRLAAFSTAVRGLVAPALAALAESHPDLQVILREEEPWQVVEAVAAGQDDLGVVHSWGDDPIVVPDSLETTRLSDDLADLVVPAGHSLAGRDSVTPHDLVDVSWIATPEGSICRAWLIRMYAGTGARPRIAHVAAEFDSHLALVAAGCGVALVPRLGRGPLPAGVAGVRITAPEPTRTILLVHRRSLAASPALQVVVEALRVGAP